MTELWFRNPHNYVRELAEVGGPFRIAWDRGMLIKRHIDPIIHAKLYFGHNADVEILAIGNQGTAHLDYDHPLAKPKAVYPTWEFGENFNILEEMVSSPIGMDAEACSAQIPLDQRPVVGQDHRVIINNLPNATQGSSRAFYRNLKELQEEYPECKIMLHGSYSFRLMFGMGYYAADYEPRSYAANGKVQLPNGKTLAYARTVGQMQWINLMDTTVPELKNPKPRCVFNIKSARWAAEHFTENVKFRTRGEDTANPDSPVTTIPTTSITRTQLNLQVQAGDKITCDSCSLSDSCKYYREGAVCSVPGTESSSLAKAFQSRDSGRIIDGLGTVLAAQTRRLERGMESEEEFEELDPEVTKLMNQIFTNGIKLAKLVDPTLSKPLVQINNGNAGQLAASNPKELMASIVRTLEDQGIPRHEITAEMVENMLRQTVGEPQMIEGKVVNG
jgi:hypothetical protein